MMTGPVGCVGYRTGDNLCFAPSAAKPFPASFCWSLWRPRWGGSAGATLSVLQRRVLSSRSHGGTQTQALPSPMCVLPPPEWPQGMVESVRVLHTPPAWKCPCVTRRGRYLTAVSVCWGCCADATHRGASTAGTHRLPAQEADAPGQSDSREASFPSCERGPGPVPPP